MKDRFVAVPSFRPAHPEALDASSALAPSAERLALAAEFGPLARLIATPDVTDVFINAGSEVWADRGGGLVRADVGGLDPLETRDLAVRLVALGGRHVDEASPCVDVRLSGGVRVHVVLPPISPAGTMVSVRLPPQHRLGLDDLASSGMFGHDAARLDRLVRSVGARTNLLITGAGGSGNTTWNL